jgi:hypothetical protein
MDLNVLRRLAKERVKTDLVKTGTGIYRHELKGEIRFNMLGSKNVSISRLTFTEKRFSY